MPAASRFGTLKAGFALGMLARDEYGQRVPVLITGPGMRLSGGSGDPSRYAQPARPTRLRLAQCYQAISSIRFLIPIS